MMKIIMQTEASECGLACLAMISDYHGNKVGLSELRNRFSISLNGATLSDLINIASNMHLAARPLRLEIDSIGSLSVPCILHWNMNHFVILKSIKTTWKREILVTIVDPAVGERNITLDKFSKHFTGVAVELSPMSEFIPVNKTNSVSARYLMADIKGIPSALLQVFALAFALEILALVSPLFNQFVIDEVIARGNTDFMLTLSLGFGIVLITKTFIELARSWFLMRWSMEISLQLSVRVFRHLVSLTIPYFEKRHLGDIVSRFGSIEIIQNTLTSLLTESVLDGLMAVLAFTVMLVYSPKLSLIVVTAVISYALLRYLTYDHLQDATTERTALAARERSHFLETLRAITPLKIFGREAERTAGWHNLKIDLFNRDVRTKKISIVSRMASATISGAQNILIFYMGSKMIWQNSMTIGMLMAFISYSTNFSSRMLALIDVFSDVKLLGLQTDRLEDILFSPQEIFESADNVILPSSMDIKLKNIKFRYGDGDPWVLDGVNLEIPSGQNLALIGPSGCGKTTLCKIIAGLLVPTEGEIFLGGVPVREMGLRLYRQYISAIMQDDVLLSGTIAENISFFDSDVDFKEIENCALMASVHTDIESMPMQYQTLVGDLGSSLSGGQKQRILLARALYKTPSILALDEATSHLDLENERKVNSALQHLKITRVMVAHRPSTIETADRVVLVSVDKLRDIRVPPKTTKFCRDIDEPILT